MALTEQFIDDSGNLIGRKTVQSDFDKDSLSGKATDFTKKRESAANDERYREEAANQAQYAVAEAVEEELQNQAQSKIIELQNRKQAQSTFQKERFGSKKALRGVSAGARWAGLGLAVTVYFWQLACALISLIGIATQATITYTLNETMVGSVINKVASFVGFDLASLFPADMFGMAFWALSSMIALCTMVGFFLWFVLTDTPVIDTPLMFLATALTLALSILPISNLFPWIPLWVLLVNIRGTALYAKDLFRGVRKLRVRT